MTKPLPKVRLVDQRGDALIPQDELPFIGCYTRGKTLYFSGHWKVSVPADRHDAELLGQEMALAFLGVPLTALPTVRHTWLGWLWSFSRIR